jgi:hypothetical protein
MIFADLMLVLIQPFEPISFVNILLRGVSPISSVSRLDERKEKSEMPKRLRWKNWLLDRRVGT